MLNTTKMDENLFKTIATDFHSKLIIFDKYLMHVTMSNLLSQTVILTSLVAQQSKGQLSKKYGLLQMQ